MPCVPIFRQNGHLWHFRPKFGQKLILGSKSQKSKSGFGISIFEILSVPIFRQNGQLWSFGPKFAQKWILGSKFQKSKSGFWISILEMLFLPICRQNRQFEFLGPNLPKNGFRGQNFKNLSLDLESSPMFSQNGQLLIFWPKFGEIVQLRAIFRFKYCWGCCRELGGGWNELGEAGWRWMEVGRGGCTV